MTNEPNILSEEPNTRSKEPYQKTRVCSLHGSLLREIDLL